MLLMLTTVPGVEEVVLRELQVRFGLYPSRFEKVGLSELSGRVLVRLSDSVNLRFLSEMRSIEKAFLVVEVGEIGSRREDLERTITRIDLSWLADYVTPYLTLAVRSVRAGDHEYTSPEIARLLGSRIVEYVQSTCGFRPQINLDDPDVVIEFDVIGNKYILGLELLRYSLRERKYRVFYHEAAINPILAFAMNVLLDYDPERSYILMDPLCGSGTIVIEGLHYYRKSMYIGVDIDKRNCRGALQNCKYAKIAERVEILSGDSTRLSNFIRAVDGVVTNPPFGIRLEPSEELGKFYMRILREISNVLSPRSRAVIITPRVRLVQRALEVIKNLRIYRELVVEQGGMRSTVFVLERE